MSLNGAVVNRGTVAAVKRSGDGISAMIGHGVAVSGKIALLEIKTLYELGDAVALGIDAAYDATNNVRWFRHIQQFYRFAPRGTKLYIMMVSNAVTSGALTVTMEAILTDATNTMAEKLIREGAGEIKQTTVLFNPAATYTNVSLNGMEADVFNSIAKAQALYDKMDALFMPCQFILEGVNFNGLASAAQNLLAITNLKAHKVSIVIGQDWTYAETQNAIGKKMADAGAALGCVAYARVSQNIGDCEDPVLDLTDATKGFFTVTGLSSHDKTKDRTDLNTLDQKGYVFCYNVPGLDGSRWNGDWVCAPAETDAEGNISEYSISLGRTMDKIRRGLRAVMLPKVRTTQRLDPTTGRLSPGTVEAFNALGDQVFQDMDAQGDISGGRTNTDPTSNLLVAPRILKVGFRAVPMGQIDEIQGKVNLNTTI